MTQPLGFETRHDGDKTLVCKLNKTLYGLKQAPRAWFHKHREFFLVDGFILSKVDASLFIKTSGSMTFYVLVYVDDIVVTGNQSTR